MAIPNIIVLATGKGGAGKSTLARALASHWLMSGRKPALIDADPQASIARLHNPDGPLAKMPVIEAPEEGAILQAIDEHQTKHSPVIVDTAGFRNRTTIMALVAADLVLIPLKPSAEDAREAVEMMNVAREVCETDERQQMKPRLLATRLVLTMTTRGTVISRHIRKELEDGGYAILQNEMIHRVAYPEASISGLSPNITDPDGAAARDIAQIANEIAKLKG